MKTSFAKRGYQAFAYNKSGVGPGIMPVCTMPGTREEATKKAENFCRMMGYEFSHIVKERVKK